MIEHGGRHVAYQWEDCGLIVFACSVFVCAVLILTKNHHIRRTDYCAFAVQSAHSSPTPRVGGLALAAGLIVSVFLTPDAIQKMYALFVFCLVPVFSAGFAEDLGYKVSPRWRLIAAALSSLLAVLLLDVWVARTDVPGFDRLLTFRPVAVAFTMFATAGVCNAFNLIDGLNGLSSGTAVITAITLAVIAHLTGQAELVPISIALIAALLGFLSFNYPCGKIFLGDAGAYALGHALAWFSLILMSRVPDLSPWAVVLVFFWPLAETIYSIWRRRYSGRPTDQPDYMHFHQLVMRFLEIRYLGRSKRSVTNPLATFVMMPFICVPPTFGTLLWDKPLWAFFFVLCFGALFVGSYLIIARLAVDSRRKT